MPGDFPLEWEAVEVENLVLGLDLSRLNSLNLFINPWAIASWLKYNW